MNIVICVISGFMCFLLGAILFELADIKHLLNLIIDLHKKGEWKE